MKKVISLLLVLCMVVSLAACSSKEEIKDDAPTPTPTTAPAKTDDSASSSDKTDDKAGSDTTEPTEAPEVEVSYTYNTTMGASPITWNPHAWEMNNESDMMSYIDMPLVDTTIADDGVNFVWVYEMADNITDVTATFADKAKYGIADDETWGRVFQIDLNPNAKWDDGTPINADTYVYSMQQLLNPEMKNYRSNTYTDGESAIYNGKLYFNNDKAGSPKYGPVVLGYDEAGTQMINPDLQSETYYLNVDEACYFFGADTISAYIAAGYESAYPSFAALSAYVGAGYVEVTDDIKAVLEALALECGDSNPTAWMEMCSGVIGTYEAIDFSEVGLVKTGDYQILYITENPLEMFYFLTSCTSNWIVKEDLYEAGKTKVENLVTTNYGTAVDNYSATGPYKVVSFEKDKQFILERNEHWYGWTDGKHEGQYQTTKIKVDIIADHNTELQLFNQGAIDDIALTSDDMTIYRMSDNLLKTDQTYTFRYIFASDIEALASLEQSANDGSNKKILSYDDFRKAISLAMDRTTLAAQATSGYKPAYYLLNYLYYYDIANNTESQYRNTDVAKKAVLDLYGITYGEGGDYATVDEGFAAVTGYDVEQARELFQSVYEQAIADGNYTDGQAININCMCSAASALTADDTKQQDLLNQFVAEATKGTGLEGKITFTFQCGAQNRYEDVANGRVEMIRGAWGGAAFYPFSTIRVYTEPDYMGGLEAIHESCGWNPSVETIDVTYDFDGDGTAETVTDTFQNWAKAIQSGGGLDADIDSRLYVLSALETGVMEAYQCIPFASETMCSLYSKQIEYATYDYNIMYGYGGIRLMTYNYTDAEWEAYVAEKGGTLNYE